MTTSTLIAADVALATQCHETREVVLSRRSDFARTAGHGRYRR